MFYNYNLNIDNSTVKHLDYAISCCIVGYSNPLKDQICGLSMQEFIFGGKQNNGVIRKSLGEFYLYSSYLDNV